MCFSKNIRPLAPLVVPLCGSSHRATATGHAGATRALAAGVESALVGPSPSLQSTSGPGELSGLRSGDFCAATRLDPATALLRQVRSRLVLVRVAKPVFVEKTSKNSLSR